MFRVLFAITFLYLVTWSVSGACPKLCPYGFERVDGYCLIFGNKDQAMTWWQAERACSLRGGQLVSLDSESKQVAIKNHILNVIKATTAGYWTSGTNNKLGAADGNSGYWWRATGQSFAFTSWCKNEPNNSGGNEHFVHFGLNDGKICWNDLNGFSKSCTANCGGATAKALSFICQPCDGSC